MMSIYVLLVTTGLVVIVIVVNWYRLLRQEDLAAIDRQRTARDF